MGLLTIEQDAAHRRDITPIAVSEKYKAPALYPHPNFWHHQAWDAAPQAMDPNDERAEASAYLPCPIRSLHRANYLGNEKRSALFGSVRFPGSRRTPAKWACVADTEASRPKAQPAEPRRRRPLSACCQASAPARSSERSQRNPGGDAAR